MRILWNSNSPLVNSGYGTQTKLFVPQLIRLGHPTAILAYYGAAGGMTSWNGIPVYPPHLEPHGQDVFGAHAVDWRADIGMSLMDLWVTAPERYPKLKYCVTADTCVTMADGTSKAIVDVNEGDLVLGALGDDPTIAKVTKTHKISSALSGRLVRVTTERGDVLHITEDNLVWANTY